LKRKKVTDKQQATSAKSSQPAAGTSEPGAIVTAWAKARERLEQALRSAGRDPAEAAANRSKGELRFCITLHQCWCRLAFSVRIYRQTDVL
jgi:hypothetical protein